jgi:hypothetical protein
MAARGRTCMTRGGSSASVKLGSFTSPPGTNSAICASACLPFGGLHKSKPDRLKPVLPDRYAEWRPFKTALTRDGVSGAWRMRAPVASKIALAMAAAVARLDGSPAPLDGSSG